MEQIDIIIGKKLAGETTVEEQLFLKNWRAESPENERYFQEMERVWQRVPAKKLPRPLDVESALQKTKSRIAADVPKPAETPVFRLKTWWLAAAAAFAVAVAAVFFFEKTAVSPPVEFAAGDSKLFQKLPDGSEIKLNRHSKIRVDFSKKTRRVELEGEAFFEVAPDAKKPFTVFVKNLEITAVGTAFNVYETAPERVVVQMAEGKVRLKSVVGGDANNGPAVYLVAGESAIFDRKTGQISIQKMSPGSPADGWFSRRFDFDGTPLSEVLPVLEKAYNVRISLKNNELRGCKLRTRFSNEPIEQVIEVLAETFSLTVERVEGGYILNGAGCE